MNWDNLDWDNFSCVDMMRAIRNEIDAKLAYMNDDEISEYMRNINLKFRETNVSKEKNYDDLPQDLQELHGIFEGTDTPDKKELRKAFHEKHNF